tara:strand:+ start:1726 stop:3657 length:1932 start_codon:yes stop_codon:yes gene_type:complete
MPRIPTTINISNPKRYGYDLKLDDILLRTATSTQREMTIQSSDVEGGQVNVRQNAEDFTSNLGRVFSRNDFSGGSNLDTAHRRSGTEKDTIRFWDSQGVDVFKKDLGETYNVSLLETTSNVRSLSSSDGDNYVAVVDTVIYVSDDATLYKSDDGGDTFSTQTTGLTGGYHIKGLTAHGNLLYITANNGSAGEIETLTSTGTSTQKMSAAVYDKIFSLKGVLFVSIGNAIHQYDGDTTVGSAIVTLPPGETFTDVCDAGAVVLATATDGRIYSLKDVSGTFQLKGQTEITNEIPTCIAESNGLIFYGTREDQTTAKKIGRLYRAELTVADDLYVLANNQLIKQWDVDGIDNSPKGLYATRDSVYTGIKESGSTTFLWRYYLPSAGIARYYKAGAGGVVQDICNVNEKFIFSVVGSGVYKQTSVFETEGFILLPAVDFFTAENKQFVGAEVSTEVLPASTSVEIAVSTKFESLNNSADSSFETVIEQTTGAGDNEVQIEKVSRYLVGKLTLKTSNTSNTPKVKSVQLRALARPELVVARIPINISDRVERPGRKPIRVKSLGDALYNALRDKEGDAVTLEIFDPSEIIRGVVESISYPVQSNTEVGSVVQYAILTVRGTRQNVVTDVTSAEVFGINALGFMKFGA